MAVFDFGNRKQLSLDAVNGSQDKPKFMKFVILNGIRGDKELLWLEYQKESKKHQKSKKNK